jgi:hypothetical protein
VPDQVQAEDRAHRIGQASSVNIYLLHARGSIDDVIWAALQDKLEHVGQARRPFVFYKKRRRGESKKTTKTATLAQFPPRLLLVPQRILSQPQMCLAPQRGCACSGRRA